MASQILFFNKNTADFDNDSVSVTATQGNDYGHYILNRSNNSAWITTDSVDSDNTTLTVDMIDIKSVSNIFLVKHNFKSFTIKYWNGSSYVNFSTPINESTNTEIVSRFQFTEVDTSKIQIIITGTQTPDSDKYLFQFIATTVIGQLEGWPIIKNPKLSRNKKRNKMLSGKVLIKENIGAFSTNLTVKLLSKDEDLTLIETLYAANSGFLVWLCGGDEDQFSSKRIGYRLEDFYLMKTSDEWSPEWVENYTTGLKINIKLEESVN